MIIRYLSHQRTVPIAWNTITQFHVTANKQKSPLTADRCSPLLRKNNTVSISISTQSLRCPLKPQTASFAHYTGLSPPIHVYSSSEYPHHPSVFSFGCVLLQEHKRTLRNDFFCVTLAVIGAHFMWCFLSPWTICPGSSWACDPLATVVDGWMDG